MGSGNSLRILLVASLFKLPYRVLRCAHAAGATVFVLGDAQGRTRPIAYSRFCAGFIQSARKIDGSFDPALAEEIEAIARRHQIDMVLASDAPSTRSVIAIRDLLSTPCFPMPTLEQFDMLNDKWRFGALCRSLGIAYPESRILADRDALVQAIDAKAMPLPQIAKPLSMDGSDGCIVLAGASARADAEKVFYSPVLVQEFIAGEDIGASVFCTGGKIEAFIAHRYGRDTYRTFFHQGVYDDIARIAESLKLDGVYNFDMRLAPDGRIVYLECNPRFFFKIAMSMVAGMNFVAFGLPGHSAARAPQICPPVTVPFLKATMAALKTPREIGVKNWDAIRFLFSDPAPYLAEEVGLAR